MLSSIRMNHWVKSSCCRLIVALLFSMIWAVVSYADDPVHNVTIEPRLNSGSRVWGLGETVYFWAYCEPCDEDCETEFTNDQGLTNRSYWTGAVFINGTPISTGSYSPLVAACPSDETPATSDFKVVDIASVEVNGTPVASGSTLYFSKAASGDVTIEAFLTPSATYGELHSGFMNWSGGTAVNELKRTVSKTIADSTTVTCKPDGSNTTSWSVTIVVLDIVKLPLGSSEDISKYIIGKVYVPTKWGGTLSVGSGNSIYYTDGSDLTLSTASNIYNGTITPVATGTYTIPKDSFKWYYVRRTTSETPVSVTSSFSQSKTVTKSPWTCPWYPFSDEQSPNLYDNPGCLQKYDGKYSTTSRDQERLHYLKGGHYFAMNILDETDAECTLGLDIDNADADGDDWTGWDADFNCDFWDLAAGDWGNDTLCNAYVNINYLGHCDLAAAAIICESEPTESKDYDDVTYTVSDRIGLLVALYHGLSWTTYLGPDPKPHEWHSTAEENIMGDDTMFACDVYNSSTGVDQVWNYPVYELSSVEYKEKSGQTDEKVVEVTCVAKYWTGSALTLYYKYYVTYGTTGVAASSVAGDWLEHPSAPTNKKKPDSAWVPSQKTSVDSFWNSQLNYTHLNGICR